MQQEAKKLSWNEANELIRTPNWYTQVSNDFVSVYWNEVSGEMVILPHGTYPSLAANPSSERYVKYFKLQSPNLSEIQRSLVMKIACYCRVSTRHQKNDSQESEIKKWLEANGIDPSQVVWYLDHESGKTLNRPAFERLQKSIFNGQVKTVVVWKLDRLSRRLRDGVNLLADWCERGLKIVVITQQIELNGPVGRMIAAVMLGLAEIELEYRRERQMAGIEVARKKGKFTGRKKGTTKAKPQRATELKKQGLTAPEIAQAMGTSIRTVWRYLES